MSTSPKNALYRVVNVGRVSILPLSAAILIALLAPRGASAVENAQHLQSEGAANAKAKTRAPSIKGSKGIKQLQEVVVTAQRHVQNLQQVHAAVSVLNSVDIRQLHLNGLADYEQYLPSVSIQQGGGSIAAGPGFAWINMRGVASGGQRNYSGSSPTVAMYLDDEPLTTIQGPIDLHLYDINRIEVLEGPQSTLFGASAESGAIRIITNQPDPNAFSAQYSIGSNKVQYGDLGYTVEGTVNLPLKNIPFAQAGAVRASFWRVRDAGYMDNDPGERTFPSSGITISNAPGCIPSDRNTPSSTLQCIGRAQNNYNSVLTQGARAALKVDLSEDWSATLRALGQQTIENGTPASDPTIGRYSVTHFYPERVDDRFAQAALSVQGKIANFDVNYTYSRFVRNQFESSDYSDYGFWYDTLYGFGNGLTNNDGETINPAYTPYDHDTYTDSSNELHVVSPRDERVRFVGGVFDEHEKGDFRHNFFMNGLSDFLSVPGHPGTMWYNTEARIDKSLGVYGQLSYDVIPNVLTVAAGGRYYKTSDRLYGFYGFSAGYAPGADFGVAGCINDIEFRDAPCLDYDKREKDHGTLKLWTVSWHLSPNKMIYVTRSEGFRPGGINRNIELPAYQPDFLVNYELGWKTSWLDHRLVFNGDVFYDKWNDFQFTILGPSGLGEIKNASQAHIRGAEADLNWQASYNLNLRGGVAVYDAKLAQNYCGFTNSAGIPVTDCPAGEVDPTTGSVMVGPLAPAGTRLPITPIFKGNLIARYEFSLGRADAFWQVAFVHVGARTSDLRLAERSALGGMSAYNVVNLSGGMHPDGSTWSVSVFLNNAFGAHGQLYKYSECSPLVCAAHNVVPLYPNGQVYTGYTVPRSLGILFTERFGAAYD